MSKENKKTGGIWPFTSGNPAANLAEAQAQAQKAEAVNAAALAKQDKAKKVADAKAKIVANNQQIAALQADNVTQNGIIKANASLLSYVGLGGKGSRKRRGTKSKR
jgi:hypothetical protein